MSTKSIGTLSLNLVANTGSFEEGTTRAERATEKLNKAVARQKDQLQDLIGQIDPVVAEYNRLDKMEEKLRKHRDSKLIDDNDFNLYTSRIKGMRDQVGKASVEFDKNGLSAKQMAFALRGVPAQFTDIAVSLQGGQNPLTVFLQQGGQLKDMFGGIAPAARAMGGYILGLVNPFTVAAASAGVLAFAYYKGSIEADRFRNALILTGNASGTTVNGLTNMAKNIEAVTGTQRQASAALAEIAGSGKFTADQIELVGKAALQMENVTGKAVADTVAEFAKLTKEPAKNIAELNEKYNFLTSDIYEQIAALEEQGNTQEASSLAMKTYADVVETRTKEITENLGSIENAWKMIKEESSKAWSAILNVGRTDELSDQIKDLDKQISEMESGKVRKVRGKEVAGQSETLNRLKQQREELQAQLDLEESKGVMQAEAAKIASDAIKAQQDIAKITESTKTNEEKRAAAIQDYYNNLEKARAGLAAAGKSEADSELFNPEKIARDIKAIEDKFKEANKAIHNSAAEQMIQRLREQEAALNAQLNQEQKIGEARRELIKFDQKIADLKNKEILTASEKSLIAEAAILRAQLEKNAAIEDEIAAKTESLRLSSLQQSLMDEINRDAQNYNSLITGFGMGDKEREKLREREKIINESNERIQKLQMDMLSGDKSLEQYEKEKELLEEALAVKLEMYEESYEQLSELEGDWMNGASEAMQNYIDNARDIAGQTEEIFTKMFGGLEDAVVNFVKTGELSMRDLMASIAEDVIRMLVRIGIQKMATWAIDKLFGAAAAGSYFTAISGQATAMNFMAGLNAFASTAAIPVVGPGLAPAAMSAALAISSPLALGAITAAGGSLAGMAHSGLDYIPQEGTWLLDKGERVLSPRQNEDLTRFLSAVESDSGRAGSGGLNPASGKVELQFNFTGLQNEQLMEMLMENRGAVAGMVSSAFEDQGIRLG
ncbi:phage tail tape measure protein [Alishewanella sp. 16-MA]|uniref:Phage tail tape measure protein n=2 Tax=Gammaproteobacteria TaxID=1236 RepID=A0ABS8C1J6_9ALTE|nr:phage tail tape measure protein [Alishewanella maricola]MCB5226196.1 phage tail tape measure protein [Alishewanella maricola]